MTTANKVTLSRMMLIPIFVIVLMCNVPYGDYIALAIFALASLTDGIDGYIARKYNQVTDFGKFLDPLADKLLIATALICFVELQRMPAWMAVVIIAREFIVTGLRSIAASKGIVIAAIMTGKIKTCIQIVAVICVFLFGNKPVYGDFNIEMFDRVFTPGYIAMFIATIYTIYSGIEYLAKNKELLADQ